MAALLTWLEWGHADFTVNATDMQAKVVVDFAMVPQVASLPATEPLTR